jgi:protein SCO1/2
MQDVATTSAQSESEFAALIDAIVAHPDRHQQLTDLLPEDHPSYYQRGTETIVRMRGWVLIGLARTGVPETALIFLLEELDTGIHAYLVAAAAQALRSYRKPDASFAPFVLRAINNIRYHDEPVSFERYGEYATSSTGTSPIRELLATLAWLGPCARGVLPEVEQLRGQHSGISRKLLNDVDHAIKAIKGGTQVDEPDADSCCLLPTGLGQIFSWAFRFRPDSGSIAQTVFEDQDRVTITFNEFFRGQPIIVVFFYTRCDNPLKCSLTIAKLAQIQKLLETQGLAGKIRTAAITYDPAFDGPDRLRGYAQSRGVRLNASNRMLRTVDGLAALQAFFKLGVNFIGSLVSRHRVEVYVLDSEGRIAFSFQRLRWDEKQVVERAVELLEVKHGESVEGSPKADQSAYRGAGPVISGLASLGIAFFPKCPFCWAAYLSLFGIAGLEWVVSSPWLLWILAGVLLVNLLSLWIRARATGRMSGFWLAVGGALVIAIAKLEPNYEKFAVLGVALTMGGSLLSALRLNSRFAEE